MAKTEFYSAKKSYYTLHQNKLLQTVSQSKNLDYTTTDLFSPLADVKADICNLPLKTINIRCDFMQPRLEHS
jgi:hypothetical protein